MNAEQQSKQAACGACIGEQTPPKTQRQRLKEQIAAEEAAERTHAERQLSLNQVFTGLRFGFTGNIQTLQEAIFAWNEHQGFWGPSQGDTGTKIALMHSELSEALEADRKQIDADDKIPDFSGLEAELADCVIRILDFAGAHRLRLGDAIIAKLQHNLTRPYRHGKKY